MPLALLQFVIVAFSGHTHFVFCIFCCKCFSVLAGIVEYSLNLFIPRRSQRDKGLALCVRVSVHSVRPHFLSVGNHISVHIGQI